MGKPRPREVTQLEMGTAGILTQSWPQESPSVPLKAVKRAPGAAIAHPLCSVSCFTSSFLSPLFYFQAECFFKKIALISNVDEESRISIVISRLLF